MSDKLFLEVECDGDWKDGVFVGDVIDALKGGLVSARIIKPADLTDDQIRIIANAGSYPISEYVSTDRLLDFARRVLAAERVN